MSITVLTDTGAGTRRADIAESAVRAMPRPSFMPDMKLGQYFYWYEDIAVEAMSGPERALLARGLSSWAAYYTRSTGRKYSVRCVKYREGGRRAFEIRRVA